jgi:hypothetical protein
LNFEVDNTTNNTLQESSMANSVASSDCFHLNTVAKRNCSLKMEVTAAASAGHRQGGCTTPYQEQKQHQRWSVKPPHFSLSFFRFLGFLVFNRNGNGDGVGALKMETLIR